MKYPKISKLMKKQRKIREATLAHLESMVGVTASYLSQVENGNKLPSKEVLFKLAHWLSVHSENEYQFKEELFSAYAEYKKIDKDDLMVEFSIFIKKYLDEKTKPLREWADDWSNNRIQATKHTLDAKRIEKPYFDLKWLLTQKEYEVFYGREYDIQGTQWVGENIMDKVMFNRLHDEDIEIIHDMIEAYISNRYGKVYKKREAIREEALKATGHNKEGN
ncbi:helix-turn-helix domain-containing protein [Oceanobacillus caeni]|uniref:helix-turn-helix domain-containing protein n=1 Tax=Virgibacillus sp. SK37 TaxID=403957 RepID=UPI001FF0C6AC|nr:helix-turn-helix transcriptional regulator [Virgibacillus sp. SK37]